MTRATVETVSGDHIEGNVSWPQVLALEEDRSPRLEAGKYFDFRQQTDRKDFRFRNLEGRVLFENLLLFLLNDVTGNFALPQQLKTI